MDIQNPKIYFYQLPLNEHYYGNSVVKGLRANGVEVMSNELAVLSNAEHFARIQSFQPDIILTYGFTLLNLLHTAPEPPFFWDTDAPLVTIFADNPLRYLYFLRPLQARKHWIFCCDSQLVRLCRESGLPNTVYLPLFYDPEFHYPRPKSSEFSKSIVFPGTLNSFQHYKKNRAEFPPGAISILTKLDQIRKENPFRYVDFFSVGKSMLPTPDIPTEWSLLFSRVCSQATLEQKTRARIELFDALSQYEIDVYGVGESFPSWPHVRYHPYLHQHTALPFLYSSCAISLCLEIIPSCVHQRVYEASASGGFIISEWRNDYENLFTPDEDIVMFANREDLQQKVDAYLHDPEARRKISDAARRTVSSRHTVQIRMREFLSLIANF